MYKFFTKTSLLLALFALMGSYSFAQTPDSYVICNFESGTNPILMNTLPPQGWGYNGSTPTQIVANPDKSGINTSDSVMYCIRKAGSGSDGCQGGDGGDVSWAGPKLTDEAGWTSVFSDVFGGPVYYFTYNYMHIMMYCNQAVNPAINLGCGDIYAMNASDIVPYTWVDVVFDVSACGGAISQLVIEVDQNCPITQDSQVYLDNITLSNNSDPVTTGIKNVPNNEVSVYVDKGILHISGSNDAVTVYNIQGQSVYQNISANNLSVGLANGLYVVKVGTTVKKIVIQ
jgi:hypothetical protein